MTVWYHPFQLTLRAPALLTGLDGDPNSAATLDHIPGSVIRGAVAARLDPTNRGEFRELVLDGAVRYLPAWPVRDAHRGVPIPRSLRAEKGAGDSLTGLHDLAAWSGVIDDDHDTDGAWPTEALADTPAGCFTLGHSPAGIVQVKRSARVHQQRHRERGRAWTKRSKGREEAVGTVFTYESLDEGQTFEGLIAVEGANDADCERRIARVKDALRTPLLLGRSRRAGYGGDAVVAWGARRAREVDGRGALLAGHIPAGTEFRALLTSPCIVRSPETGQVDPSALPRQLEERLAGRARVSRRRWGFTAVGGFNRTWGLELPQALAVAAGSVLVLEATADIPHEVLLAAEHAGVGERRVEGFGRVCFLPRGGKTYSLAAGDETVTPSVKPSEPCPPLVAWLEQRVLARDLDGRIAVESATIAGDLDPRRDRPPKRSLLGRLRVPLRGDPTDALETLRRWLGDGADALRRPARAQLDRCRIKVRGESLPLSTWIERVVDGTAGEALVDVRALAQRRHLDSEDSALRWLTAQRNHWRVRLLDATFAALALKAPREK